MHRAYSLLEVKGFDEEHRTISGMATTPETDRVGDIVDPMGASFQAEMPLLWQHQHDKPVGVATFGKATKRGISFTARIAAIAEDGPLKSLVDMAWQSVKAKLVKGVSIGFRPIEYAFTDTGMNFVKTEIYELSLVTIPANASATIQTIKALGSPTMDTGAVRLMSHPVAKPDELNGAVRLVSARSLASVPLKAHR
jgi:HK97 family phage prohead protease